MPPQVYYGETRLGRLGQWDGPRRSEQVNRSARPEQGEAEQMSSSTPSPAQAAPAPTFHYAATDPHRLAILYLKKQGRDSHGHLALRYWRDEFWRYHEGRYRRLTERELRGQDHGIRPRGVPAR